MAYTFSRLHECTIFLCLAVDSKTAAAVFNWSYSCVFLACPRAAAPTFAYASAKSVSIKFPAQGNGITKLAIEMAVWCAEPFADSNKKKGLLTDTSKHIGTRTTGLVRNLHPGRPYVFRLQVTNHAGTVVGPASKPIKTLPKAPAPPREDTSKRTDTTIGLKFAAQVTLCLFTLPGRRCSSEVLVCVGSWCVSSPRAARCVMQPRRCVSYASVVCARTYA